MTKFKCSRASVGEVASLNILPTSFLGAVFECKVTLHIICSTEKLHRVPRFTTFERSPPKTTYPTIKPTGLQIN